MSARNELRRLNAAYEKWYERGKAGWEPPSGISFVLSDLAVAVGVGAYHLGRREAIAEHRRIHKMLDEEAS